jgi:uncharacterized Rmd1/YagE family protein
MKIEERMTVMDSRMDRIETTLDTIAKNHLSHIERYTKWTLVGIIITSLTSLSVVAITVL